MQKQSSPSSAGCCLTTERSFEVVEYKGGTVSVRADAIVVEEPMEIRIVFGSGDRRVMRNVSITMRTPGHDEELAVGFLFTEGLLRDASQIESVDARGVDSAGEPTGNVIRVHLRQDVSFDPSRLQRNFVTTSSCGVCGKASLDGLAVGGLERLADGQFSIVAASIYKLPEALRHEQATFSRTGGLHGSAFFNSAGMIAYCREDVGRHNAVDKLIGRAFLDGQTPADHLGMIVSGRVSFEILQKALVARVPLIVAVGAPSSLAVETAQKFNLTLIGFASSSRFNVYSSAQRIQTA